MREPLNPPARDDGPSDADIRALSDGLQRTLAAGDPHRARGGLQSNEPEEEPAEDDGGPQVADERPNARFWIMLASFTLSWFTLSWPGFTSPVIASDCEGASEALNCELDLSAHGQSIFLTAPGFIGLAVVVVVGPLIDRYGRKPGVVIGNAVTVVGWVLLALTPRPDEGQRDSPLVISWLVVGRLLSTAGAVGMTIPVMLSEIAPAQLRGRLMLGMILLGGLPGAIVVYGVGIVLAWRGLCWVGAGLAVASTICSVVCVTESPLWLLRHKRDAAAAAAALRAIRHPSTDIDAALAEYGDHQREDESGEESQPKLAELLEPQARRPLLIMIGLLCMNSFNGIQAVGSFTGNILEEVFDNRNLAALAVPSISPLSLVLAMPIADRWGRRPLLLASCAGMALSGCALAVTLGWAEEVGLGEQATKWLSLSALILFMFTFQLGMGPLPALVITELVPPRIRGIGAAWVGMVAGLVGNATVYAILPLRDLFGYGWLFTFYSGGAVLGLAFVALLVPETNNRSLEAISREIGTDQAKKAEGGGVGEGFEEAVVAVRACVRRHGAGLGEEVRKALGEVLDRAVARQNA